MARLRQVYPNILGIQPAASLPLAGDAEEIRHLRDLNPDQLFRAFFQEIQGRPMDDEEAAIFLDVSRRVLQGESQS